MATNQVNIVNLLNLPQAQVILPGNYLIVNNDLGTQIIDWADVAVLKLDDSGGATITSLTATNIIASVINSNLLSASNYYSNGQTGTLASSGYYNTFTVTNGIITNADYIIGSPEYTDIVNTQLPALTSQLTNIYKKLYIDYITPITVSSSAFDAYFKLPAPDEIVSNINNLQSVDITWSCTPSVTCIPTFTFPEVAGGKLHVYGSINYAPSVPVTWSLKILKDYQ
jgi:hypothetical protein